MANTVITGPILDSFGQPANGYLYGEQTARQEIDGGLITAVRMKSRVIDGVPFLDDGVTPLEAPPTPDGESMIFVEDFRNYDKQISRSVIIPASGPVGYAALQETARPATLTTWVVPGWARDISTISDQVAAAVLTAQDAAESADSAKTAAEEAAAAAEAVGTSSDAQTASNLTSGPLSGAAIQSVVDEAVAESGASLPMSVALFGNSLVESTGINWPGTVLAPDLGVAVYNGGKSGWASSDIALRQGGLQLAVTLTGNQIPTSGPVTVTAHTPTIAFRVGHTGTGHTYTWTGVLAGVSGVLTHEHDTDTWFFTRSTGGTVVAVPAGTLFVCTDGDPYRGWIQVWWASHNNFFAGSATPVDAARDYDSMARWIIPTANSRFVILGEMGASYQPKGSTQYQQTQELNGKLGARYGSRFIDVRAFLIAHGLAFAGITPSSQDRADLANDIVPDSLRADTTHLNATGYGIVSKLVANRLRMLGLAKGQAPIAVTGTGPTAPVAGASTTTSRTVSWNAVSGAVGYRVDYRRQGASVWLFGAASTGLSATVNGLDEGINYEIRVVPINIAGPGPASPRLLTAAGGTAPTVITSDSFDRANSTSLGSTDAVLGGTAMAWVNSGGQGIVSNQFARINTTSEQRATIDMSVVDGRAKVTVNRLSDAWDIWVFGRFTDTNNYYRILISAAGNLLLRKKVAGTEMTLATVVEAVNPGDVVALSVVGSTIRAFVNENPVAVVTDTAITTGTAWGIGLSPGLAARLDDFVMYSR